jgi:hypothetical protein
MSKNPITIESLEAERLLLEQAVSAGESLIAHLKTGIANIDKNEAARKVRESVHWLLDAQASLAAYTARFKDEEATRAAQTPAGPTPGNVVAPAPGAFSGKPPENTASHSDPSVLPVGSTEAGSQAAPEEAAVPAPETPAEAEVATPAN